MSEKKSYDERQKEVDRQLELMKAAIGEDSFSDDDSDSNDSSQLKERNSKQDAMESARKFLWDEDDHDDEIMIGGPFPKTAFGAAAGEFRASKGPLGGLKEEDIGLKQSINLMDVTKARTSVRNSENSWLGGSKLWNDAVASRESEEFVNERDRHGSGSRNSIFIFIIYACLLAILAAVLFFYGGNILGIFDGMLESSSQRIEGITDVLIAQGFADKETLRLKSTPQSKALTWLALEDPAKLKPNSKYLPQRYALAVLYLETYKNDGWKNDDNWLSGQGYCSWYGIDCVGETDFFQLDGDAEVFELNLTKNELKGTIPTELVALSHIFELDLGDNHLHGSIPTQFGDFMNLRAFSVAKNHLDGEIPSDIWSLPALHAIALQENKFRGSLPQSLGFASNLRTLKLDENMLSGALPNSIHTLSRLENLHLGNNRFTGSIPTAIYQMARLEELELQFNNLVGTLSTSLAELSHLELLTVQGNKLSGEVPDAFKRMTILEHLHLQNNQFTGTIPVSMGSMRSLRYLSAQSNPGLGGTMPANICTLTTSHSLTHLSVDCSNTTVGYSTGVVCSCCTQCF